MPSLRWIGGKARCSQSVRSQRRQVMPIGTAALTLWTSRASPYTRCGAWLTSQPSEMASSGCAAPKPPRVWRTVRATHRYVAPSGMRDSCVRTMPGVMNALWTFQRGQRPENRANRIPEAE
jgi:hypothetical protein